MLLTAAHYITRALEQMNKVIYLWDFITIKQQNAWRLCCVRLVGDDLYDPSGNTIVMRLACAKLNSKLYELNSSLMYKYAEVKK